MLKNFMQPGNTQTDVKNPAASRADPNRFNHTTNEAAKPVEPTQAESKSAASSATPAEDGNKLIVGPNIKLKGSEITDCEILVVEGRVEASMNSRDIRIAEGGVFSGKAEIDVAEIRGHFEGELTARKRLVIYSTGKVSGVIRYGAMMVEEGGTISGDVATIADGTSVGNVAAISPASAASSDAGQGNTDERETSQSTAALARNAAGRR